MDYTEEERRKKAYEFYKEKFNIDLENLSPEKTRQILAEINKKLDEEINKALEQNKKLNIEIFELNNTLAETLQNNNE